MTATVRRLIWVFVVALTGTAAWIGFERLNGNATDGAFSLVDVGGKTVTERDFLGRPYGVYFGYTHCPDVCPTTLSEFQSIEAELGDGMRDFSLLFITVDPARDTPDVLRDYLSSFSNRVVGLSGSEAAVADAVRNFHVYARRVDGPDGDYSMDHTATTFLFDRAGRSAGKLLYQAPHADAVAAIKALISAN